jgi:hypothetical protein
MRYVIVFTKPDGTELVATSLNDDLALIPLNPDGSFRSALSFESPAAVKAFLKKFKEIIGDAEFQKLWNMKPVAIGYKHIPYQ